MTISKRIDIFIDQNTWPRKSGSQEPDNFPDKFTPGPSQASVEPLIFLWLLGHLTTPLTALGLSLSEHWAWIRYLNAISRQQNLMITTAFAELDSHLKTILSDDFGMAIPMYWLANTLSLDAWCDGGYYARRMAHLFNVDWTGKGTRGPGKSPDFVCSDSDGKWHVVECKGTQGKEIDREKQFTSTTANGEPSGGKVQKKTLTFPASCAGQRLVTGLLIPVESTGIPSSLRIDDPAPPEIVSSSDPAKDRVFDVKEEYMVHGNDPIIRAMTARALTLLDLPTAGRAITSPDAFLEKTGIRKEGKTLRQSRSLFVEERDKQATHELNSEALQRRKFSDGQSFIERTREIVLPRPVQMGTDTPPITRVTLKARLDYDVIEAVLQRGFGEEPISLTDDVWKSMRSKPKFESSDREAHLRIGENLILETFLD